MRHLVSTTKQTDIRNRYMSYMFLCVLKTIAMVPMSVYVNYKECVEIQTEGRLQKVVFQKHDTKHDASIQLPNMETEDVKIYQHQV